MEINVYYPKKDKCIYQTWDAYLWASLMGEINTFFV